MDDNDEQRSRGVPSRTIFGKRGSIIKEYPALGQPLVLFGGLWTIPYWGYRNTPLAELEVMLADMPHVMYNYKEQFTDEQIENRRLVSKGLREKVQKGGLQSALGFELNFGDKVIDGDSLKNQISPSHT